MSREQKMQAVAEAARVVLRERLGTDAAAWKVACARLDAALATLDAHTEAQAQEAVTLAVWEDKDGGVTFMRAGRLDDRTSQDAWRDGFLNATRLGTVTLPLKREGGQ